VTTLTYPSVTFPGRPALVLDLPEGWQSVPAAGEIAGASLAALRSSAGEEFKANIFIVLSEVPADHTVEYDLAGVERTASERPEGVAGEIHGRNISGVTFFTRDLSYVDPVAGTLLVSSLFGFLRHDADRALVRISVTATISAAGGAEDYAMVHGIVNGLTITPAPGTTPLFDPNDDPYDDGAAAS
jgi:hypothetical protein